MPDWSIKIVRNPSAVADEPGLFVPDLKGAGPGTPLQVQADDLVSWNNTTHDAHQPWPCADATFTPRPAAQVSWSKGNYLANKIPAKSSSQPAYNVVAPAKGTTLYYCCLIHPKEHGTMVLVDPFAPPLTS